MAAAAAIVPTVAPDPSDDHAVPRSAAADLLSSFTMADERRQLEAAIASLASQRALLGDAVVDAMLAAARDKLASLAQPGATGPRLKQLTILFVDVVGSTRFAQHLDPEEVATVMDDALARATKRVEAHSGRTLQYAGDSVLAVFGFDEAREDDPERAVRCGLDLLALGRQLRAEIEATYRHADFDFRIGVHTGDVLVGSDVADGLVRGHAVHVAARMEQTAPAGRLRISHACHEQLRGLFEVEAQPPLTIKGVDEPVRSYLVVRARPRSFRIGARGIEGVSTRMIGRDAELEVLQAAFLRLFQHGRLDIFTVVADAGIGKSRLLQEFHDWSDARPETFLLFQGRASPQTQGQPFGLLRDIVAWRFKIADDDTVEAARQKLERGIVPLFEDEGPDPAAAHAHLLGHLIGVEWRESPHIKGILDDPRQLRNRAFHAAAQMFRRLHARSGNPIVLQIEDLHWADNESLDFLAYLTEVDRDVPMLVLAFTRPTLFERRPGWIGEGSRQALELKALDQGYSRDLASELLKKLPRVPAALRELIIGGSEGNPFYMEELVKMLIDQGAILTGDPWSVDADKLRVVDVPSTLTGVLQARLDSLPAQERGTLQAASVIGPVFWDRALHALDDRASATLPALVARQLALPRTDVEMDDLHEFAFRHAMLHQVTYATLLKRTRRTLHGQVARWLVAQTGLRANDFLAAAAAHFEEAGDSAEAAEYHARAAEQARARMAHQAVLLHVGRALALMEHTPDIESPLLRWRLLVAHEATLEIQGDRPGQRAAIEALLQVAEALDDDRRRAYVAWRRSDLSRRIADFPTMESAALRAVECAARVGDVELRLKSQRMIATARAAQGDLDGGQALAERTLDEARTRGLRKVEGDCLNTLGVIADSRGDAMGFLERMEQSFAAYQLAGDRRGAAIAKSNLGVGWVALGALERGRSDLTEGLRLIRENGDRALECSPLRVLAMLSSWQGNDAEALTLARKAVDTAVAVGARDWEAVALGHLGDAEVALGRHDEAARAFESARRVAVEIKSPVRYEAAAGLARVAIARGDGAGALAAIDELLRLDATNGAVATALEGTDAPRLVELTCHRVLDRAGDARALDWLRRAHEGVNASADRIRDPKLRDGYLRNVPHNRAIVEAWSRLQVRPV